MVTHTLKIRKKQQLQLSVTEAAVVIGGLVGFIDESLFPAPSVSPFHFLQSDEHGRIHSVQLSDTDLSRVSQE